MSAGPTDPQPYCPNQEELARAMQEFCRQVPASLGLGSLLDNRDFLYHFEAERLLTMRQAMLDSGFQTDAAFQVLDFGYLHGLVPEFLHRFFPHAKFTIFDHPASPNFKDSAYLELIKSRTYLTLKPCRLEEVGAAAGQFDLIILGEIIEHLDPTIAARAFADLRKLMKSPGGRLLITTPNGACIKYNVLSLLGHEQLSPPIPDGTMGYPHIHFWSQQLLQQTLGHFDWENERVYYNHGRSGEVYAQSNRSWGGLKFQLLTRLFHHAAQFRPRWREFMISTWKPK